MPDGEKLIDVIYEVMREHGTDLLYPEDEFRCCAEHLAGLFEPVGWRFIRGEGGVFGARGVDYSGMSNPDANTEVVWAVRRADGRG